MDDIVPGYLDNCAPWNDLAIAMRHVVASQCNNMLGNCREKHLMSRSVVFECSPRIVCIVRPVVGIMNRRRATMTSDPSQP